MTYLELLSCFTGKRRVSKYSRLTDTRSATPWAGYAAPKQKHLQGTFGQTSRRQPVIKWVGVCGWDQMQRATRQTRVRDHPESCGCVSRDHWRGILQGFVDLKGFLGG